MTFFRSLITAFSMYSRIPMPNTEWNDQNTRYVLAAFPAVGCFLSLALSAWYLIAKSLQFGGNVFSAGVVALIVIITGGIHLDGFCDTVDALASHAAPDKKREILKDSHAGAFAVIGTVCLMLCAFALLAETYACTAFSAQLIVIPVLGRAASGIAGITFPVFREGTLHYFSASSEKRTSVWILIGWIAVCSVVLIMPDPVKGVCMLLAAGVCMCVVYRLVMKEFKGMSGDIAGFLLCITETAMLLAYIIAERILSL